MAWSDSNAIRTTGYVFVALLMLLARRREQQRVGDAVGVWPPFWVITCTFLVAMAVGRALDAGGLVSSLGRSAAYDRGWYVSRRPIQAAVVGSIGVMWFVLVAVALWRTPARRRRYLPVGSTVVTLAAFAAIRVVSLHQVDGLLYRTRVAGVRVATLTELGLLGLTALATRWCPPAPEHVTSEHRGLTRPDRSSPTRERAKAWREGIHESRDV